MRTLPSIVICIALFISLAFLPMAAGEVPQEVTAYCTGFDQQECADHASWFSIDACKSMVKCVADIDTATMEYQGCRTVLKDVFDDCENYPSTLCYNGVAYDTSYSETCSGGAGARFRTVDSCGNPKELGPCLKLDTCEERTVSPYTGTSITVHVECELAEDGAMPVSTQGEEEAESLQPSASSSSPTDEEDGDGQRDADKETPTPAKQETAVTPTTGTEDADAPAEASADTAPQDAETKAAILEGKWRSAMLPAIIVGMIVLAIGIIVYWYIWHRHA